jgi:hypothetical protein
VIGYVQQGDETQAGLVVGICFKKGNQRGGLPHQSLERAAGDLTPGGNFTYKSWFGTILGFNDYKLLSIDVRLKTQLSFSAFAVNPSSNVAGFCPRGETSVG